MGNFGREKPPTIAEAIEVDRGTSYNKIVFHTNPRLAGYRPQACPKQRRF